MSKAIGSFREFPRPYFGVVSYALNNSPKSTALDLFSAKRQMAQVLGSPHSIEPSMGLSGSPNAIVPYQTPAPARKTTVIVDTKPKKSLLETVTQPKVLLVAGSVMAVAGAAAAFYFFPVASAHAATIGNAGHALAMNTHQLFIQPGIAHSLLLADLVLKAAVIPAAKLSLPVLLPVISTAIVTTLGTLLLIYLANQAWKVAKVALWGAGTAVVNRFNHECDQTYFGMAARAIFMKSVFPAGLPFANPPASATQTEDVSTVPADVVAQQEVQSVPLQIAGFVADPSVQVISQEEADQIEAGKATRNKRGQKAQAAARARRAQIKAQSTWLESIMKASLVTAGVGASVYFYTKAKPDFDSIGTEL